MQETPAEKIMWLLRTTQSGIRPRSETVRVGGQVWHIRATGQAAKWAIVAQGKTGATETIKVDWSRERRFSDEVAENIIETLLRSQAAAPSKARA